MNVGAFEDSAMRGAGDGGDNRGDVHRTWHLTLQLGPLAGCLSVSLLALGGVTTASLWLIALVVTVCAAWCWVRRLWLWSSLSTVLAGLASLTAVQCIPLPWSWVSTLSPAAAETWASVLLLSGETTVAVPLAIDPAAAMLDAWRLSLCAVLAACVTGTARRFGSSAMAWLLVLCATLLQIATLGHLLLGAQRVFGVYQPKSSMLVAPLMNANSLCGVLSLGTLAALGLLMRHRRRVELRAGLALLAVVLSAGAVWTGSRAGVLSLLFGVTGFCALALTRRGSGERRRSALLAIAGSLLLGVLLASFSAQRLRHELLDESTLKLKVFRAGWEALHSSPWLGFGRGAFGAVISPVEPNAAHVVYDYAENFLLEAAAGWGIPVALVVLGMLLWTLRPNRQLRGAGWSLLGVYVGICTWLLHNLMDLGSELPGVALYAVAALASVLAFRNPNAKGARVGGVLGVLPCVSLTVAVAIVAPEPARVARADLQAVIRVDSSRLRQDNPILRRGLAFHPADPYVLRMAALAAWNDRDPRTLRWLGVAMARAPRDGRALLLLAGVLRSRGATSQAMGALKRALELEPDLASVVAQQAVRWDATAAGGLLPDGPGRVRYLLEVARRTPVLEERVHLLTEAVRGSASTRALADLVGGLLEGDDELCRRQAGAPCLEAIEPHLVKLEAAQNPAPGAILRARALRRSGDVAGAYRVLDQRCRQVASDVSCQRALLEVAPELGAEFHRDAVERLLNAACREAERCAEAHLRAAQSFARRHLPGLALDHAEKAGALEPTVAHHQITLKYALQAKAPQRAMRAAERIRRLGGEPDQALADGLRRLLLKGISP